MSLRDDFPGSAVIACTATATSEVKASIIESLGLDHPLVLEASFNRKRIPFSSVASVWCVSRPGRLAVSQSIRLQNLCDVGICCAGTNLQYAVRYKELLGDGFEAAMLQVYFLDPLLSVSKMQGS